MIGRSREILAQFGKGLILDHSSGGRAEAAVEPIVSIARCRRLLLTARSSWRRPVPIASNLDLPVAVFRTLSIARDVRLCFILDFRRQIPGSEISREIAGLCDIGHH
ncbi:MAG: hypothetical protein EOP13_01080, partial [Pseudomonas sp.]|uniref:hypothetical protein n=1 Tax=Pseudomonas sp. TaxID=306 RepID=UPI00121D0FE7